MLNQSPKIHSDALSPPSSAAAGDLSAHELWTEQRKQNLPVKDFTRFKGYSIDQLKSCAGGAQGAPDEDAGMLLELIELSRSSMDHMNRLGQGLPSDSEEHVLSLLTAPGARTVVLTSSGEEGHQTQVAGYGLIITEKEGIRDLDEIPEELKTGKDFARAIRFFIRPEHSQYGAYESSASRIIDTLADLVPGKRLIAKVLVGPPDLHPIWFEAGKALDRRGFQDTPFAQSETVILPDGTQKTLHFKWRIYPPETEERRRTLEANRQHFQFLKADIQQRFAPVTSQFKVSNGSYVLMSCNPDDPNALASMLLGSHVTAIDLQSAAGRRKMSSRYRNLSIRDGDGLSAVASAGSVDGFFNNSILGLVCGREHRPHAETLRAMIATQVEQLKEGGSIIIRNPVKPSVDRPVILELNAADGAAEGASPATLSTAALFRRFLTVRGEQAEVRPLPAVQGRERFLMQYSKALHFAIIKDYRRDFDDEALRPVCAFTREEIEKSLGEHNLRIVSSAPEYNQWVQRNSFDGALSFYDESGALMDYPASNYRVTARKVGAREGTRLTVESSAAISVPEFLRMHYYSDPQGGISALTERRNQTLDIVPWFEHLDEYYVLCRNNSPRPITCSASGAMDDSRHSGYLCEQIAAIVDPAGVATPESLAATISQVLEERASLPKQALLSPVPAARTYYSAPMLCDERVVSVLTRITPSPEIRRAVSSYAGLPGQGVIQPMNALQILNACQTGDLPEPRVERKIYELLISEGRSPDGWVGPRLSLEVQSPADLKVRSAAELAALPPARHFTRLPGFAGKTEMQLYRSTFAEYNASGEKTGEIELEHTAPAPDTGFGTNTAVVAPLLRVPVEGGGSRVLLGLKVCHSAAAQRHTGNSVLLSLPSVKLPLLLEGTACRSHTASALWREDGLRVTTLQPLGGPYFSTPGAMANMVHPFAAEVDAAQAAGTDLLWIDLREFAANLSLFQNGDLLTCGFRSAHMLGLL